jgi:4-amino-4-deoxy-L-arabinose transferase-like glycosyltransferase
MRPAGNRFPLWTLGLLIGAVTAGIALRGAVQVSSLGVLDGDEAVWGLMVRHVLHGEFTTFYWGQGYGGTQEVLLTAPLFALFGTSMLAARMVPMALVAIAAVLVWRVGRRTVGEPAAIFAGALLWVWPPYLIWKSDRAHGFYGSGLVLASLVLLLVLRLLERRSWSDSALLGLVIGLAWWQTPQVVPIALPALAYLAVKRRTETYRIAWVALPLAVLGALPWLISNVRHHWWSFHIDSGDTPYLLRLRGFFSATLPMAIGLRVPFTSHWLLGPALSGIVYAILLGVFGFVLWRKRRQSIALLAVVAAAYPFLYAISPATWLVDEPRYVVLLLPVLVLLLAQGLTDVGRGALCLAGAIALSALVLVQLASSPEYDRRADGLNIPRSFSPLVAALDRRGLDRVFADYWVAYRLDFETHERVIAAEALLPTLSVRGGRVLPRVPTRPNDNRHAAYDTEVRRADNPGYVLLAGTVEDARARPLLESAGYVRESVGGFAIYEQNGRS